MKAVIMAGGEGTRLRPISLGVPKPMVPLLDRPVMEHIIGLLKRHGITDICVTLHYLPQSVMDYFGDGERLGVKLTYFLEEIPLGTAGSVKNCQDYLGEEDFLVISGDSVCDLDLSAPIQFHRERKAQATLVLYRHPTPLEYGLVLTDREGRVVRFVEKPSWGQVITNTVNTGIYILSRPVLERIPKGESRDFGRQIFPAMLEAGDGLYACPAEGYWCDMGDCKAYLDCAADALSGKVKLDMGLPQRGPGVWSAQSIPEGVTLVPPCWIGPEVELGDGCLIGPHTVLGRGSRVGRRSLVQRSVLLGAQTGDRATLYGAALCRGACAGDDTVLNEGAVLGENALAEEKSILMERVKLWPARVAPAGCRLARSITGAGPREPVRFGDGGVIRGALTDELGPEVLLALGSALGAEGTVALGAWGGEGAQMLCQAAHSGAAAAGGQVLRHNLECAAQAAWLARREDLPVSLFIEQEGERIYLHLFDRRGLPLSRERQRKLEHALLQGEAPRVSAGKVGGTRGVSVTPTDYARDAADRAALHHARLRTLKVAVGNAAPADRAIRAALQALGCTVEEEWRKGIPAFAGSHGGFRLTAQDESGAILSPQQLLTLTALVELEDGSGRLAVPAEASAALDLLAAGFHAQVLRLGRDGEQAEELYASMPWLWDAAFAAVRLCARMALTGEGLGDLSAKTPRFASWKREVPLAADRGEIMRQLAGETGQSSLSGEGVRLRSGSGWVYLVPLARRSALKVVAEGPDLELAAELCDFYAGKAERLDRRIREHSAAPEGNLRP